MKLYTVQWSQPYVGWPKTEDLALAREVIAKIMQKRT
jgi:hypothetical protein